MLRILSLAQQRTSTKYHQDTVFWSARELILQNFPAGGDVAGLQAELERLASLAAASTDKKVREETKLQKKYAKQMTIFAHLIHL